MNSWESVENKIDVRSSIHTFIVVVLLGCLTFWLTKNYFGRKLIGLRWWNGEEEKGEGWVFESRHPLTTLNPIDRYIFWTVLYCSSVFWLIMFVLKGKHFWGYWWEDSIFRLCMFQKRYWRRIFWMSIVLEISWFIEFGRCTVPIFPSI